MCVDEELSCWKERNKEKKASDILRYLALQLRIKLENPMSSCSFRLERDAGGVVGLHVAFNLFDAAVHRRLFESSHFCDENSPPFKGMKKRYGQPSGPQFFSHDWHRLINTVRDSGLFPDFLIPNYALMLNYPATAQRLHVHIPLLLSTCSSSNFGPVQMTFFFLLVVSTHTWTPATVGGRQFVA